MFLTQYFQVILAPRMLPICDFCARKGYWLLHSLICFINKYYFKNNILENQNKYMKEKIIWIYKTLCYSLKNQVMLLEKLLLIEPVMFLKKYFIDNINWKPSSLSELTPYLRSSGLTQLGSEASSYSRFYWLQNY